MPDCAAVEPLFTPYIDGELSPADTAGVAEHLRACGPCRSRVAAERAVRTLLLSRKPALHADGAPGALHSRCAGLARAAAARPADAPRQPIAGPGAAAWRTRLAPLALAASLVLAVGAAFVYRATEASTTIMAAELAADHVKCFMLNAVMPTDESVAAVERSLADKFEWDAHLPAQPGEIGMELVGERTCLYGEGPIAHVMYRREGRPVSLFMLPDDVRAEEIVRVMGHHAAVWSVGNRTFVLVGREPEGEMRRLASFVGARLR